MKTTAILTAVLTASFALAPALAADKYKIDPDHAWINFSIKHAPWSNAQGKFKTVKGEYLFDKEDLAKSSVSVEIDTASVDTNQGPRDDHLKSPDFFNAAEFPTMTFVSTAIEKTGEKTGKITGDLTLLGVSKPVTFDVTFNGEAPYPWDASVHRTGFSAALKINPGDFGMAKVAEFGMGPEVDVTLNVEGIRQ